MNMERERLFILASFAAIYFIWGSTYLAMYYVIQDVPPFLMASLRFIVAGMIMWALGWRVGVNRPSRKQTANAILAGFLFLALGSGGVAFAQQYVDTGVAALIVAGEPLLVILLIWAATRQTPHLTSFAGIALGILGMYFLVSQSSFAVRPGHWTGVTVIIVGITAWAIGSVFVNRADLPSSQITNASIQMLAGGFFLALFSISMGEIPDFSLSRITVKGALSWVYLVTFGSIIAFSAFNYLLKKVSPEKVATCTYVNPVVAMILGIWFNDEIFTLQSLIAACLLLSGVFFISYSISLGWFSRKIVLFGKRLKP